MNQEATVIPVQTIRILKTPSCPNLSGKADLTYHIGISSDAEIMFRVASNSGGGYFSPEWVSLKFIQDALENGHKPLTSFALSTLFRGKSVNTPSFLFAALLAEGLVQRDEENPRVYVALPPDAFMAEIDLLVTSGVDVKVPEKVTGKGVVKNRFKKVVIDVPIVKSRGRPKKAKSGS